MAYEVKAGDGALFKNERQNLNQPNATGYIIAHRDIKAGERVRIAAWTKDGKGGKWQSLRMSDERGNDDQSEPAANPKPDTPEIPF